MEGISSAIGASSFGCGHGTGAPSALPDGGRATVGARQGGGRIGTLILGVIGALLGGPGLGTFFEIRTWLFAIGGSLVVLIVWGLVTGGHRRLRSALTERRPHVRRASMSLR